MWVRFELQRINCAILIVKSLALARLSHVATTFVAFHSAVHGALPFGSSKLKTVVSHD